MALNKNSLLILGGAFLVFVASMALAYKVALQNSITPNAPSSKPSACTDECPREKDGALVNCTGSADGTNISLCNSAKRVEMCGGTNFCCPAAGGAWTTTMTACCVDTSWTPDPATVCAGVSLNQLSNCGKPRTSTGTKTDGSCAAACTVSTWTPAENTICNGTSFTQTSNCSTTKTSTGTKTDGVCLVCTDTTWTPATSTVCTDATLTQTSNCGKTREVAGTKVETGWAPLANTVCSGETFVQTSNCGNTKESLGTKTTGTCAVCVDTTWTPNPNTTCMGESFTQTSNCGKTRDIAGTKTSTTWTPNPNTVCTGTSLTQTGDCGNTRDVAGSKYCCIDTTWTPTLANTCSEKTLTQTSNCGNEREQNGTKTCLADLSILTKSFANDTRNKPGVYFTDKLITKVSRDQFYVYTMEVKNSGLGTAKNFKITDTLTGQNQNLISFEDAEDKCTYDFPSKKLSCEIESLAPNASAKLKFRVKSAQTALNAKVIRNTAKVSYGSKTKEGSTEVLVSSIVSCNEYCTNDSECIAGLSCDVFSNKCRKARCAQDTTCGCITPAATAMVTKKITPTVTIDQTEEIAEFPDSEAGTPTAKATVTPIEIAVNEGSPVAELPKTGIFDLPQSAFFGTGLILAVLGIFLAL